MATENPRRGSEPDADLGADDRVRDADFERDFGAAEPPDPLGQAMPDITEAHVAEAGGPVRRTRATRRAERAERGEAAPVGGGGDAGGGAVAVSDSGGGHEQHPERAHPRKGL